MMIVKGTRMMGLSIAIDVEWGIGKAIKWEGRISKEYVIMVIFAQLYFVDHVKKNKGKESTRWKRMLLSYGFCTQIKF